MTTAREILEIDGRFRLDVADLSRVRQGLVGTGLEIEYQDGRWVVVRSSELTDDWQDRFDG